ncbi:MAG: hypothetical protein IRZ11_00940 [Clostridia bacterium]|nr:hypothetical protein [Clostridia bacterium]
MTGSGAEPFADLVRILLLASWTAPLAAVLAGAGGGGAGAPLAAAGGAAAAYLAGAAFLRAGVAPHARRAAAAATWAAALAATVVALGPAGLADALAQADSFFLGGRGGAEARKGLLVLAVSVASTYAGLAAGRAPASAERAAADWRLGAAGWLVASAALDLRGAAGRPLYGPLSLSALAFVALSVATATVSRQAEASREGGGDPLGGRRAWLFAAGGAGAALAALSLAALAFAPEAMSQAALWLGRAWSLIADAIALAALPLGYLAGLVLYLVRSHVGAHPPSEPAPLAPAFASEAGRPVPVPPLVEGGARALLAVVLVAFLAWLAARLLRPALEPAGPQPAGEERSRIPRTRAESAPGPRLVAGPPYLPARRALWRVKRALVQAGYPRGESASAMLRRAAHLAAEAGGEPGSGEASAPEAAALAEALRAAYWPERYRAKSPAAAAEGAESDAAFLDRAARLLARAVRRASREGRTPRVAG